MSALDLAERLIAAGIPVVVVKPTRIKGKWRDIPQSGWNSITADQCDLSSYRPGKDALALVGGHGIDAVDVDTKVGGSVDYLPPFKSFGMTRTPSGGEHYIVPSCGLGKISPLKTPLGIIGDYVGGRPDGTGRLLLFLPGSVRHKYPDGGYVEEALWRIEECLTADPDPDLVEALENAGGGREQAERYVDAGPQRDPALGVHPRAAEDIAEELARLDMCTALGWDGPPWDETTYEVACNLIEYANSGWTGYTYEQALEDFLDHAPMDEQFTTTDHEGKWESALHTVGDGCKREKTTPEEDFAEPVEDEDDPLFDATPVLKHIRQAAHSRMVGAPALLCYVLGRVLAEVPPEVALPPVVGGRASLNLGIAVVGDSGAGKSSMLSVSRELFGLQGLMQEDLERNVGSGEGLVQSFLQYDGKAKENVLIDDPRRIINVDEIDSLGATKNRSGATIGPTIRSALTGGSLGQENATADRKRNVKANTYRLVMFMGVQPTRSGALLEDSDAGTPQRLVWVKAADPSLDPDAEWPGALDDGMWDVPSNLPPLIDYPLHIKAEVKAARLAQVQKGADALEGHKLLTRLKVSAALALLHGEVAITNQWWGIAGSIVDDSMAVQEFCRREIGSQVQQAVNAAAIAQDRAEDAVDEEKVKKAARAIRKNLQRAGGDWVGWYDARPAHRLRDHAEDAIKVLSAAGEIEVEEYINDRGTEARRMRWVK